MKKRKALSILVALVMVFTLLPAAAYGANDTVTMTLDNDASKGGVILNLALSDGSKATLSQTTIGNGYEISPNSTVTVTVGPKEGYEVTSIRAGEPMQATKPGVAPAPTRVLARSSDSDTLIFTIPASNAYDFTISVSYAEVGGSATPEEPVAGALPTIPSQPRDVSVAVGEDAVFSVVPLKLEMERLPVGKETVKLSDYTYQWYTLTARQLQSTKRPVGTALVDTKKIIKGASTVTGSTTATLTLSAVPEALNGVGYYCVLTNSAGSVTSDVAKLTVTAAPVAVPGDITPTVSISPASQSVAWGDEFSFKATATAPVEGGTLSYQWSWHHMNDVATATPIAGATSATYTSEATGSEMNFYYFCTVTHSYQGQTATASAGAVISVGAGTVPPPATSFTNPFTDVKTSHWFYSDVMNAVQMGLINGKTPTTYVPGGNLTIAEAIKLAACMHQYYNDGAVTLKNGSPNWYDTYVAYAEKNGIIAAGQYKGKYNNNATRAQYVSIFYYALPASEYAVINNIGQGAVPDVKSGDAYASEIYAFYRAGILTGNDAKGTFAPNTNITRDAVATILSRMMDDSVRKSFTL